MTRTHDWPAREEWEADQRRYVQGMVESGNDCRSGNDYDDGPGWSTEERAEVEALTPAAVKVIRRECGRIEKQLRKEHPAAAAVLQMSVDDFAAGHGDAALAALRESDRGAWDDLWSLRHVRNCLRADRCYGPFDKPERNPLARVFWPQRYPEPISPELDRIKQIGAQAIDQYEEVIRRRGRKLLADLDSGAAWQEQLEHMASVDKWFRDGPVIHHGTIGPKGEISWRAD